jgi:hypothetical protein
MTKINRTIAIITLIPPIKQNNNVLRLCHISLCFLVTTPQYCCADIARLLDLFIKELKLFLRYKIFLIFFYITLLTAFKFC